MAVEIAMPWHRKKQVVPLPYAVYLWTVVLLTVFGLLDSTYLAWSHYRNYTDISYQSFCAVSRALNCDTVSQSPYAIFLDIPVAVWGIFAYGFFLLMLACTRIEKSSGRERPWTLLLWTALVFSLSSIVLAVVSWVKIHSYCIMCLLSYAINFALVYFIWIIRRRFHLRGVVTGLIGDMALLFSPRIRLIIFSVVLPAIVILTISFYPRYWQNHNTTDYSSIPNGITAEGYPWIGAKHPSLEITEFTDYLCFQCGKMNFYLLKLVEKYPSKIRLVHRHFPMDNELNPLVVEPFHVGSGKMALLAEYAKVKGKFWMMNDILFRMRGKKYIDLKKLGEKIGIDDRILSVADRIPALRYAVKHDIANGIQLGITGTPGFVINGKVYQGQIPAKILRKVTG